MIEQLHPLTIDLDLNSRYSCLWSESANFDNGADEISQNTTEDVDEKDPSSSDPKPYSPVLKSSMFQEPDLPGVDAVYVNRLKDGDFPDLDQAEDDIEDVEDDKEGSGKEHRNPFIQFECEEEGVNEFVSPLKPLQTVVNNSGDTPKPVKLMKLNPPPFKSPSVKRKRDLDESVTRIDSFLQNHKSRKVETNNESLKSFASPDETVEHEEVNLTRHPNRRRVNTSFNIDKCLSDSIHDTKSNIVTQFSSGYIVKEESELYLMYPPRLREMILFQRLMDNHQMPMEKLKEPMNLYPGILSEDQAKTVVKMYTNNKRCPAMITDRRMTYNGFLIGLYHGSSLDTSHDDQDNVGFRLKLESKCSLIPFYGVDDLIEIIKLVEHDNEDRVKNCRAAKVRDYLSKEATKLSGDMPPPTDIDAVQQLLESGKQILGTSTTCFHGRTFMKPLTNHTNILDD